MNYKIAVGGDHAGFELKNHLIKILSENGNSVQDYGPFSAESVDYPDYAHSVASAIEEQQHDFGILVCGSGNGVCMTANKHKGVRAALVWNEELAALAKQHNNANIICMAGRFISFEDAGKMVKAYMKSDFEGGRHRRRVRKIPNN